VADGDDFLVLPLYPKTLSIHDLTSLVSLAILHAETLAIQRSFMPSLPQQRYRFEMGSCDIIGPGSIRRRSVLWLWRQDRDQDYLIEFTRSEVPTRNSR
jgi:hypothetical protein